MSGESKVKMLTEKWGKVLDNDAFAPIKDRHRRFVTAQLLENTQRELKEAASNGSEQSVLSEAAPTNNFGDGQIKYVDPVLISLLRRSAPNLQAFDLAGVQAMNGPTSLIFALRARYGGQTGPEALFNEANTTFSGTNAAGSTSGAYAGQAAHAGASPRENPYTTGGAMTTAAAEALGDAAGNSFPEMSFSIEKISVTAGSRALKAEYTVELAQDLKMVHGLDAETELSNILSTEIAFETNREIVRKINATATIGAQENVANAGTFDLDVDANGRWSVEKFKGLMFQIEREANAIAKDTRRGRGNVIVCSSDVASALQMAGVLDYTPALNNNLDIDDTGNTFVGILNGKYKVYIDPYFSSSTGLQYATIGYKGANPYDAGLFYCPYVPLQMFRATDPQSFQPKIGFKTRYGLVANPFATNDADGIVAANKKNKYYRIFTIQNIL